MKGLFTIIVLLLATVMLAACQNQTDRFKPGSTEAQEELERVAITALATDRTPEELIEYYIMEGVEFTHHFRPFGFPAEHLLAAASPVEIDSEGNISVSFKGESWSEKQQWRGMVDGHTESAYHVHEFEVIIKLDDYYLVTSSDSKKEVPVMNGTGTFSYSGTTDGLIATAIQDEPWSFEEQNDFFLTVSGKVSVEVIYEKVSGTYASENLQELANMEALGIVWIFEEEGMLLDATTAMVYPPFSSGEERIFFQVH